MLSQVLHADEAARRSHHQTHLRAKAGSGASCRPDRSKHDSPESTRARPVVGMCKHIELIREHLADWPIVYTVPEVAEIIGWPLRDVYSWIGSGRLQRLPLGPTVRISRVAVQKLASEVPCVRCHPCVPPLGFDD